MIYYHGTPQYFRNFDIKKSLDYKDFGRGMYLSEKYWHAESIAKKRNAEHAYVMEYDLNIDEMRKILKVKEFKKVSIPWVKFVLLNRNKILQPEYDVVIGATADAAAQDILERFYHNHKKREPSIKEYKELIADLSVHKYPKQICLLTEKAIEYVNSRLVNNKIIY